MEVDRLRLKIPSHSPGPMAPTLLPTIRVVVLALAFWLGREITISRQIGLAHADTPGVIVARIGLAHAGAEPSDASNKSNFEGAGPSRDSMDFHGFPRISMDFHRFPWISMDFHGIHRFPWISIDVQ